MPEAIEGAEFSLQNLASNLSLEGLTQLSPDGRALPKLAESWSWANDGLELRVLLRKGVTFHDGTPLTAQLAAESLQKAINSPSNRVLYTSFSDIQKVDAQGDHELLIDLARPSTTLPDDLAVELGETSNGTGPYRVVHQDTSQVELEANEHYYLGVPQIQRITVKPFGTLRTAWSSLLRGEVDMVTEVPPDAVEFVQNDEVQVISFDRRYEYVVAFNSKKPPFNEAVVRRALNAAINRESLAKGVLKGRGTPAIGPLWPQYWAYDRSLPSFGYDPALAMSLLEARGFPERRTSGGPRARFHFTCLIPSNFSIVERIGLEVQKQLYDVGVDMRFEVVPPKDLDARIRSGRFDALLIEMLSGPTPSRAYMFWRSAKTFHGLNVFGYENPEAERLFGVLRSTTNEAAIRSATRNLQRVLLDDPPALFLAWTQRSRAVRRDFQIVQEPGRDPVDLVFTIWRWAPGGAEAAVATK